MKKRAQKRELMRESSRERAQERELKRESLRERALKRTSTSKRSQKLLKKMFIDLLLCSCKLILYTHETQSSLPATFPFGGLR